MTLQELNHNVGQILCYELENYKAMFILNKVFPNLGNMIRVTHHLKIYPKVEFFIPTMIEWTTWACYHYKYIRKPTNKELNTFKQNIRKLKLLKKNNDN